VWILRHAKAVTDPPPGGSDHERELAPRGRHDARDLGKRLGPKGDRLGLAARDLPSVALCSTAARTSQTAERALDGMEDVDLRLMKVLYRADPDDVLSQLRLLDDDVRSAMVVGHNPTIAVFADEMSAPAKVKGGSVEEVGFPTCALMVVSLEVERFADADFGQAAWARLFTPPY
jgi:phosphohistidine phosphatase